MLDTASLIEGSSPLFFLFNLIHNSDRCATSAKLQFLAFRHQMSFYKCSRCRTTPIFVASVRDARCVYPQLCVHTSLLLKVISTVQPSLNRKLTASAIYMFRDDWNISCRAKAATQIKPLNAAKKPKR